MENINQQQSSPPSVQSNNEKSSPKYKILGIISIIFGFIQIPVPVGFIFFTIPQLTTLYISLNIQQPSLIPTYAVLIFLVCLGLINITIGVKLLLKSTQNKEKYFKFGIAAIIIIFLSVGSSMALTITSVLAPIYKLTSELDSSPSPTIFQAPSPTPTIDNSFDTSAWKTYTNDEYGFSFKYPQQLRIESNNTGETQILGKNYPNYDDRMFINVATKKTIDMAPGINVKNILPLKVGDRYANNWLRLPDIRLDNKIIKSYQSEPWKDRYSGKTGISKEFIIMGNDLYYIIKINYIDNKASEIFDQILSTFRFTQ